MEGFFIGANMADFKIALASLLKLEGGYVNNPSDNGGETYKGISRKYQPNWPGWTFVDRLKADYPNLVELNQTLEQNPIVQSYVEQFYQQNFWRFDPLPQSVAEKVFAAEVNFGRSQGVSLLQQAVSSLGLSVTIDGSLGPKTLAASQKLSESDTPLLLGRLSAFAALKHCEIVIRNPEQHQFLKGWLFRDCQP